MASGEWPPPNKNPGYAGDTWRSIQLDFRTIDCMFNNTILLEQNELSDIQHNFTQTIDSMLESSNDQHDFTQIIYSMLELSDVEQDFTRTVDFVLRLADVQHNFTRTIDSILELADVQQYFTQTIDSVRVSRCSTEFYSNKLILC